MTSLNDEMARQDEERRIYDLADENRALRREVASLSKRLDEAKREVAELAKARHDMKTALQDVHQPYDCVEVECPICGIILCPFDANEHMWHDGCPACYGTPVDPNRSRNEK